jgi:Fe-S-cluster containining protein
VTTGDKYLKFRCSQCGRCCRDPLLPLTDHDIRRFLETTGDRTEDLVRWASSRDIALDEPEWYVTIRQGKRVMVLRHQRGGCRYLGRDRRCTAYQHRPLGCRVFPFDPTFGSSGELRRLTLIRATDCPRALDGQNDLATLRELHRRYEDATERYLERVAEWNRQQRRRRRAGRAAQTGREFLAYLGLLPNGDGKLEQVSTLAPSKQGASARSSASTTPS